jgi:hypothetical protein
MHLLSNPSPSLGVLHVLEDTLAILQGKEIPAARRSFVLERSGALLKDATEGSTVAKTPQASVGPGNVRALESYALLHRYLSGTPVRRDDKEISTVASAVEGISSGQAITDEVRASSVRTLRTVCERMNRDLGRPRHQSHTGLVMLQK